MVGTSPIVRPSRRHCRDASSIAPGVSKTVKGLSGAVPDLVPFSARRRRRAVRRVGVLRTWELAPRDLAGKALGGVPDLLGEVGIPLDELRGLARSQAEHVVKHQHLAIGAGTCSDADSRDPKGLGDTAPEIAGHSLQDEAERSRLLQVLGVGEDASGLSLALALDFEAPHLVDELRREAEVTHDRDA